MWGLNHFQSSCPMSTGTDKQASPICEVLSLIIGLDACPLKPFVQILFSYQIYFFSPLSFQATVRFSNFCLPTTWIKQKKKKKRETDCLFFFSCFWLFLNVCNLRYPELAFMSLSLQISQKYQSCRKQKWCTNNIRYLKWCPYTILKKKKRVLIWPQTEQIL